MLAGRMTALITGASSGIGAEYARRLAADGYDLILSARREQQLKELARSLEERHGIRAEVIVADLNQAEGLERLERRILSEAPLDLLINNAGFGSPGIFAEAVLDRQTAMVNVHVLASMRLSRAALPAMLRRRRGAIIFVSSVAAFYPTPGGAIYSSSKAFLNVFAQALQLELRNAGIRIQALCPGYTYTGFHSTPEYAEFNRSRIPKIFWMSAERVVGESLRALNRGKVIVVPGLLNRVLVALGRTGLAPFLVGIGVRIRGQKAVVGKNHRELPPSDQPGC